MVGVIASVVPKLKQTELRFRRGLSGFRFGMRSEGPESALGGRIAWLCRRGQSQKSDVSLMRRGGGWLEVGVGVEAELDAHFDLALGDRGGSTWVIVAFCVDAEPVVVDLTELIHGIGQE